MNFWSAFERRFRRFAVENATLYLVAGQGIFFLFQYSGALDLSRALLVPGRVLEGEWWRLIAFLFIPPSSSLLFIFFALYLFYLMGTALENHWGALRYNAFLLTGYLLTAGVSFLTPEFPATNIFLGGSVFLAFAYLFPDFQLYLFFILPVRIKWLALLTWITYGWSFATGSWHTRSLILAAIGNVLLFFGRDILGNIRNGGKAMNRQARSLAGTREAFHRCAVCGKTDLSHPDEEFRYCPQCSGLGYCREHIDTHRHRSA